MLSVLKNMRSKGTPEVTSFLVPLLNLSFQNQVEKDISGSCDLITSQTQKNSIGNDLLSLPTPIIVKFENVSWTVMLAFGTSIQCQCFLRLQICKQACSDLYTRMTFGPVCSDLLMGIRCRTLHRIIIPLGKKAQLLIKHHSVIPKNWLSVEKEIKEKLPRKKGF